MKVSITVEQQVRINRDDPYEYRVTKAVNTTAPKVGSLLNEKALKELIDPCGIDVNILPEKRKP